MSAAVLHLDGLKRCPWPKQDTLYVLACLMSAETTVCVSLFPTSAIRKS
jgi:hypothetical protein